LVLNEVMSGVNVFLDVLEPITILLTMHFYKLISPFWIINYIMQAKKMTHLTRKAFPRFHSPAIIPVSHYHITPFSTLYPFSSIRCTLSVRIPFKPHQHTSYGRGCPTAQSHGPIVHWIIIYLSWYLISRPHNYHPSAPALPVRIPHSEQHYPAHVPIIPTPIGPIIHWIAFPSLPSSRTDHTRTYELALLLDYISCTTHWRI